MDFDQTHALPSHTAPMKVMRKRVACSNCGAHVMVWNLMYANGGQCPCCESYELVALPDRSAPPALTHSA
jgi:uncharacterized paraquat-inducible protein A